MRKQWVAISLCILFLAGCPEEPCPECGENDAATPAPYGCPVSEDDLWGYEGELDDRGRPAPDTLFVLEQEVLVLINETRSELGLCALNLDCCLWEVARSHSREMTENNYCDHVDLNGQRVADRLDAAAIPWMKCGEVLGCHESGAILTETVITAWMNSQEHRDTILNCHYTHAGIGVCADREGFFYLTGVFAAF